MIAGERPAGCEYCWKIEDMGRDAVSDRVYKSKIYKSYQDSVHFRHSINLLFCSCDLVEILRDAKIKN